MTTIGTMLIFLGTAFVTLAGIGAAPAKYDQRQEGEFNLNAKLENFLFVVAVPSNNEFLTDLALQALELKLKRSNLPKDHESIKTDEEIHNEEPYSVEIVRIDENPSDEASSTRKAEGESTAKASIGDKAAEKRSAKDVKGFEFPKSREVPTIVGYLLDPKKTHGSYKTENGARARNVLGIMWNPDVQAAKPGTSLKKQLLRREEEDDVVASSSNADKNDVASLSEEKPELWLVGHGAENCGPGSRRNGETFICEYAGSPV
nr:PREDICTED: uncharacterized protein LOC105678687 [Linepithema humile]